jgi:hypothetical protein
LEFGAHAKSQVIPGEDPEELEAIVEAYRREFMPLSSRSNVAMVDTLIALDWQLQRLRAAEAKLWAWELAQGGDPGEVYNRSPNLWRMQGMIASLERRYERTLKQVKETHVQSEQKWKKEEAAYQKAMEAERHKQRIAGILEAMNPSQSAQAGSKNGGSADSGDGEASKAEKPADPDEKRET